MKLSLDTEAPKHTEVSYSLCRLTSQEPWLWGLVGVIEGQGSALRAIRTQQLNRAWEHKCPWAMEWVGGSSGKQQALV